MKAQWMSKYRRTRVRIQYRDLAQVFEYKNRLLHRIVAPKCPINSTSVMS
jgi:hypothetical protein